MAVETVYLGEILNRNLNHKCLISLVDKLRRQQLLTYKSARIPTITDKCIQTLFVLLLDPITESTADEYSYAYRRGRNAHQAIGDISNHLRLKSGQYILNIDVKEFFSSVSHS